jgi:hypothetical protein
MPKLLFGEAFLEHFDPRDVVVFYGAERSAPDQSRVQHACDHGLPRATGVRTA